MYVVEPGAGARGGVLRRLAGYAVGSGHEHDTVRFGEGLVGQCAAEQRAIVLDGVPDGSIRIQSGLVSAQPHSILVLPVLFEGQVKAVIELASLTAFTPGQLSFLDQWSGSIGIVLNTIEASMRTEHLLAQSQQLASELQSQQKELQQTNAEIATKAQLLAEQKNEVEAKNQQIEQARVALEDKAAELALTSRYKSEFLANMSHELRTPLNSILILGQQLAENPDENLTGRQVEFAKTIHAAGTDLLNLISDILDLSKIESGTVTVDSEELRFAALRENMLRGFRHEAERRHLQFSVEMDPALGRSMTTDPKRLQQILKNLLSNAFKFTERGSVQLHARKVESGWSAGHPILDHAPAVVAFEVRDTGIGISPDKQKIVFEAFQQADAGTSRKYGGTGLGLAISREIAGLLGGELRLDSTVGGGSTFTLYLPVHYVGADAAHAPLPREPDPSPDHRHDDRPLPPLEEVDDDRDSVQPGEPCLLVIEDDAAYATILRDLGRSRGDQGRGIARTPAGRNRAVPAPGDRRPAAGQAGHGAAPARFQRNPGRPTRAGGGRRRAPHLRLVHRAGTPGHAREHREQRPGSDREGGRRRHRPGADGHHDAGHGRLRHHARDPQGSGFARVADHRADRQGDEGRPREVHGSRRFGLPRKTRGHRPAAGDDANTPIIFVTAVNVDDMDRLRGYTLGAVDYVTVPVIPDILRGKVMVLCELYRKRRELQQANEQLATANAALEAQNIAERERLNASLQAANRALEQRNQALQAEVEERARAEQRLIEMDHRKNAFLAMLAHELRNPLTPLQNALAIQRLEGRTDDALQGMMERQLLQLVRLIDDLLDVARVSRGKIALQPRPTTIDHILRVAVDTAQPLIDTGGHRLHLDIPPRSQPVLADPERLAQVFANLLNNAAKYSDPGSDITLQASQSDDAIEVSVRDTGMG